MSSFVMQPNVLVQHTYVHNSLGTNQLHHIIFHPTARLTTEVRDDSATFKKEKSYYLLPEQNLDICSFTAKFRFCYNIKRIQL